MANLWRMGSSIVADMITLYVVGDGNTFFSLSHRHGFSSFENAAIFRTELNAEQKLKKMRRLIKQHEPDIGTSRSWMKPEWVETITGFRTIPVYLSLGGVDK